MVKVETKVSKIKKGGEYAIPQGSVLGELFHVINCNDLPECHESGEAVVLWTMIQIQYMLRMRIHLNM